MTPATKQTRQAPPAQPPNQAQSATVNPVLRGCKTRFQGGVYATFGVGANGTTSGGAQAMPYWCDPPIPIDTQAMGISAIGVNVIERDGVKHIIDWVGEEFYPYPCDFAEEVIRLGLSRRLPVTLDMSQLTANSRIMLVHRKGFIRNFEEYYRAMPWMPQDWRCHFNHPEHMDEGRVPHNGKGSPVMCAGLWWCDIDFNDSAEHAQRQPFRGLNPVRRNGANGYTFICGERPYDITPQYSPAIIGSFPISALHVVQAADVAADVAAQTRLPVLVTNA